MVISRVQIAREIDTIIAQNHKQAIDFKIINGVSL